MFFSLCSWFVKVKQKWKQSQNELNGREKQQSMMSKIFIFLDFVVPYLLFFHTIIFHYFCARARTSNFSFNVIVPVLATRCVAVVFGISCDS